jgi:peptidoglycan/xylan/chitin deacetylase (PgdA/CDA1 family)
MWRVLIVLGLAACSSDAPEPPVVRSPTVVSLTFDDTFEDNLQAVTMAEASGMRATFYVNSGRIGRPGFLSRDQLLAMQAAGHEIGGHTVSHQNLIRIDRDEARRQICNDRLELLELGFVVTSFAYPFSAYDAETRQIVADCGYNSGRVVGGIGGIASTVPCEACPITAPFVPRDPYRIPTNDSVFEETTLAMMKAYVEQAEENGGGWTPFVFHHVCDDCNPLAVSPATLEAFLRWLAPRAAHGTTVATIDEMVTGPVRPGVLGPPPDPELDPHNLLVNGSFERDGDGDGEPDCWQHSGTGENEAIFTLNGEAADGVVAQRIELTSWSSGVRRVVTEQDLGACAPLIDPALAYVVRARYIASTPPRFSVYYRTTRGTWTFFEESPPLPTSASYVPASYAIPPLPIDAETLSVGLTIGEVGSITMDAFSLTDPTVKSDDRVSDEATPGSVSETPE